MVRTLHWIGGHFDLQVPGGASGAGQKTARRDMDTIYRARLQ